MAAHWTYVRSKRGIPKLTGIVQRVQEGIRILIWRNLAYVHAVSHRLNDARIVVLMVDDLWNSAAIPKSRDMLLRCFRYEQVIVENARLDASGIYSDIEDVPGD